MLYLCIHTIYISKNIKQGRYHWAVYAVKIIVPNIEREKDKFGMVFTPKTFKQTLACGILLWNYKATN